MADWLVIRVSDGQIFAQMNSLLEAELYASDLWAKDTNGDDYRVVSEGVFVPESTPDWVLEARKNRLLVDAMKTNHVTHKSSKSKWRKPDCKTFVPGETTYESGQAI